MIRVLLIDDQTVIREGLKAVLNSESDLQIVGMAADGQEGLVLARQLQPDVILVDMYMPVMDGVDTTMAIHHQCPQTKVLLLSSADDPQCITDALRAGAMGYLLKNASSQELADAIRSVHKGYSQLSPGLLQKLMNPPPQTVTPVGSEEREQTNLLKVEGQLQRLLQQPDCLKVTLLDPLMASISSPTVAEGLLPHLRQKLQRQPDYIGGYYLTGLLVHQYRQQPSVALKFWRKGISLGLTQGLSVEGHLLFCRAMFSVGAEETYRIMAQLVDDANRSVTTAALLVTAEQVLGDGTPCYQLLITAWQLQRWQAVLKEQILLKAKLDTITAKFRQRDSIKLVYSL